MSLSKVHTERICTVDGCEKPCKRHRSARNGRTWRYDRYCSMHRSRITRHGATELPTMTYAPIPCSVIGCNNLRRNSHTEYCYAHYMKIWRYGTPTPEHAPRHQELTGQRFGELLAIEYQGRGRWLCQCDCGTTTIAPSGNLRLGTHISCGAKAHRRSENASYVAVHSRVRFDRGKANEHQCVDCGNEARHWSYDHNDPDERLSTSDDEYRDGLPYSLNIDCYSPRCVSCHKRFDLERL